MSVLYGKHHFLKNSYKLLISFSPSRHLLPFSTLTAENPHPKSPFIFDYLVNTCGFSREKAVDASTTLRTLHSAENPDSVLNFLRGCGLNGTQIKSIIAWRPQLLSANVEKTLAPKVRTLQELGLSESSLTKLIMSKPKLLITNAAPFINFLRPLLGSNENVIKALNRSQWTVTNKGIETLMQPNISFLKEYGASDEMIAKFTTRNPNFFFQYPERLKDIVNRVEKMGLTQKSGMFIYAVLFLGSLSKTSLDAKFDLFKSFGWSEADTISAFVRAPECIKYSEKKIRASMDYFLRRLGYSPSYVVSHPKLLTYSLEKRIIPRFNVLRILKSKELLKRSLGLYAVVSLSEKRFLELFLHPHVETAPEVLEAYKGCKSEVPPLRGGVPLVLNMRCSSPDFMEAHSLCIYISNRQLGSLLPADSTTMFSHVLLSSHGPASGWMVQISYHLQLNRQSIRSKLLISWVRVAPGSLWAVKLVHEPERGPGGSNFLQSCFKKPSFGQVNLG